MDDVVKHLKGWQTDEKLQHACEVIVVYQDRAAQQVASSLCAHLEQQLEPALDLTFTWVQLAKLEHPHCLQGAVHAAGSADLVILSLNGESPESVEKLIRASLEHRTKRTGAIIGLIGLQPQSVPRKPSVHQRLQALADETGFDYWAPLPWNESGEIPASLDSYLRRAGEVTPLLEEILQH